MGNGVLVLRQKKRVGSFDALTSAQVYIWIIFGFSVGFFFFWGLVPAFCKCAKLWISLCFNQPSDYLQCSGVCFLQSWIAEAKIASCRKKSCPLLSGTAITKANEEKKNLNKDFFPLFFFCGCRLLMLMCFFPFQKDEGVLSWDTSSRYPCHKQIYFCQYLNTQGFWKRLFA